MLCISKIQMTNSNSILLEQYRFSQRAIQLTNYLTCPESLSDSGINQLTNLLTI